VSGRSGYAPFRDFRTWYESFGESDEGRLPLIVLHGGPGATHQYLEPLRALAENGRRVVFYDQIGCGRSDRPVDPAFYTVQTFVDELNALREHLGLERAHVLGQSWGGMLAMEYALTAPPGLASIVVADSPAGIPFWVAEANRLRAGLPPDVQRALTEHEAAGTTADPAYQSAVEVFYRRHVCRLDPWPDCFARTAEALSTDGYVYNLMNGPSDSTASGRSRSGTSPRACTRFARRPYC